MIVHASNFFVYNIKIRADQHKNYKTYKII